MAPGNHDNEQMAYFAHTVMPGAVGKNYERYSSFDYGLVHVVSLDDYDGIVAQSIDDSGYRAEVLAWLDKDLAAASANRAKVPWIVTFHHHPFFSSTDQTERANERTLVRTALQATYDKYSVDLDFCGHDHFYERSKPMVGDTPGTKGTTYVIHAGGGAPAYNTTPGQPFSAFIKQYNPDGGQGMYGLISATKTKLALKTYMLSTSMGSSPSDDTLVEEFDLGQ
jgi:3',5'-cyclic AMP phosphodiesterase CpdA